jgi:hypothetical protein
MEEENKKEEVKRVGKIPVYADMKKERGEDGILRYSAVDNEKHKEVFFEAVQMYGEQKLSSRKAAEYFSAKTGRKCAYQTIVNAWNKIKDKERKARGIDGVEDGRYAKRKHKAAVDRVVYGKVEEEREIGGVKVRKGTLTPIERRAMMMKKMEERKLKIIAEKAERRRKKEGKKMKDIVEGKPTSGIVSEDRYAVLTMTKEAEELKKIDEKVVFVPNDGPQTEFLSTPETDVLFGGSAGGGKVVKEGDRISTPFGWKRIEEVKVGDLVSSASGGVQKIIQLHPWIQYSPTRVRFSDGTFVDVHEDHLWQAWRARKSVKRHGEKVCGEYSKEVVETRTLRTWLDKGYNPLIPVTQPVVYNTTTREKDRISPYLLGVLLGDGCITTNQISISAHEDDQPHLRKTLDVYEDDVVYKRQTIRFRGQTRKWLETKLSLHGLLGKRSSDKFIPPSYLYAPLSDRWELVRGLMDTDGYSAPDKNGCYYTTISKQLSEDVTHLLRSLGCVVTVYSKLGKYRDSDGEVIECSLAYELYIKSRKPADLFSLPRKKVWNKEIEISKRVVSVEVIENEVVRGRCITVSGVDGLYLTNDFIVTHNSLALLIDPLRFIHRQAHRALILRKSMPELREIIDKTRELYPQAVPGCKYKEVEKRWVFPSGATVEFGYLERDADVYRYQGNAFSWIGFDELTHLATEFPWNYLSSRLRTTDKEITCYLRATTNPGGVGHQWVKARYISPASPGTAFIGRDGLTRRFIPSFLKDNPYLYNDGNYERMLRSLPEVQRKRLLEGDWDVNEGSAFPEFDKRVHVVDAFQIPHSWTRIKAVDYGYASPSCVLWAAIDPTDDTLIVYRELYEKGLTGEMLAEKIVMMEMDEKRSIPGVLDTAAWNRTGYTGPTIGEILNKPPYSLKLRPADKNRIAGKVAVHQKLRRRTLPTGELGRPNLQIFGTCSNLIRELLSIPLSDTNSEDVDTKAEDHAYDALRYMVMSRPKLQQPMQFHHFQNQWRPADEVFGY